MHTKDQRQYARHLVNIPVNFVVRGRSYKSWIRNISGGGVYIETGTLFSAQSVISMTYSLPDSGKENRIGIIVWAKLQGIGVKFNPPKNT